MDINKLKQNLINQGYTVNYFEDIEQANEYLCENIKDTTVGVGGSMTISSMGLYELLEKNNEVYWHWQKDELEKASRAKVYLSSVNGISEDGEIINIDGTCNRISSTLYGHDKVYFIFGTNKIEPDYEKALWRARNIAAVKNAIRLKKNTPCTKTGKCMNCNSPERICRGLSVLWDKPKGCEYEIIIINKDLGY